MTMTMTETELVHLPLDQLNDHPDNLRSDLGDLTEMVASINALGIIEPLVVTPDGALFTVLAGHRRLAAAREAGLQLVPCVVRTDVGEQEAAEIMLVENLIRTNLNPIEEGTGFARLTQLGLSQREIAERVGCNQSHVSKRIKLNTIPAQAQTLVAMGELQIDHALLLAQLVELDPKSADEWVAAAIKGGIRTNQPWPSIGERIRRAKPQPLPAVDPILPPSKPAPKPKPAPVVDESAEELEADADAQAHAAEADWGNDIGHAHGHQLYNDRHGRLWIVKRETSGHGDQAYVLLRVTTEIVDAFLHKWEAARAIATGSVDDDELDELAEEEARELHGEVYQPGGYDEDQAAELVEEIKKAHAEPTSMEEAEAAAFAEDAYDEWDQQRTTPPWKAYAFTNETKTIGGIREHKNPAKLRHAAVYEAATKNRPQVLAAIDERLAELGE